MAERVFVYGTLRPGAVPPEMRAVVTRLRRVGLATARGYLYDLGAYPGAVLDPAAESTIAGEVLELPADAAAVLAALDAYEGVDAARPLRGLFVRVRTTVTLADGDRPVDAWVYAYNRPPRNAPLVAGGDWARRLGRVR